MACLGHHPVALWQITCVLHWIGDQNFAEELRQRIVVSVSLVVLWSLVSVAPNLKELTYSMVYFKSHHCNSPYCTSGRCTSILSTCYLNDTEHFDMHHWSNEHERTRENMWCNVHGVKDCKKKNNNNRSIIRQYSEKNSRKLKQSWKCPKLNCLIKNCKITKKFLPLGKYSASNLW